MKHMITKNRRYIKLVIALVSTYFLIKVIDNLPVTLSIIKQFIGIVAPFITAFIIAYILNPLVNIFNKRAKLSRGLSIALTYTIVIALIALSITFLLPKLYSSLIDIINELPSITTSVQNFTNEFMKSLELNLHISDLIPPSDANNIITTISTLFLNLSNWLLNAAVGITSSIINIIFGFLISIYVLVDKDKFINTGRKLTRIIVGRTNGDRLINFIKILHEMIGTYIGIKALDSLIIGVLAFVGLSIINSKYTLLLSVIVGITNMIPYFGPFVGMVIGGFINVFISPMKALFVFLFLFTLQQFDGWYLDPKLIGNKVGLRPFLVILAVTIGGAVYGPVGMILGSPVMAVIKIYTVKLMNKFEYRAEPKVIISNED